MVADEARCLQEILWNSPKGKNNGFLGELGVALRNTTNCHERKF
jgi:hypothetical protein